MTKIIYMIFLYTIGAALLAGIDTYLPFIPPAAPTMASLIYLQKYYFLFVIPVGISLGVGTSVALYVLRRVKGKLLEKISNQKVTNIQNKLTDLVELIGDFAIVVAHSVGLGSPVAYIYVAVNEVDYKMYTIYSIIGRTMLLGLMVGLTSIKKTGSNIFLILIIVAYVIVFVIFIIKLIISFVKRKRTN